MYYIFYIYIYLINLNKKNNLMASRLFKLFTQKKKPKRGPGDTNQSMIDVITDEASLDDSFRSHQPQLESSFAGFPNSGRNLTEHVPSLNQLPVNNSARANISSVFNIPKKMSLVEDLYDIVQENVIDQLGDMIQSSRKSSNLNYKIDKVQASDFDLYIAKLKTAYEKYRKFNASRLKKAKGGEQVNVIDSLLKCYEHVPKQYFDENFFFNFEYLTKDRSKIMGAQEDSKMVKLGDYLDSVELNLYYQITDKFQAFLDVILKLNQMEVQIQNSLYSIRFIRSFNAKLKEDCTNKVARTLTLKRRKINIEKTLAMMDLINVVKKTLPTLILLIHKNNIESAVKLVKTSEETYKNKLKTSTLNHNNIRNFHLNFNEARNTLEKMLTGEFEERCIKYLAPTLAYNKINQPNSSMEMSMVEESFMSLSMTDLPSNTEEDSLTAGQLYWTLVECPFNPEVENNLAKIVLEYMKIKNFPLTIYKVKVVELMKKFHQQYLKDMDEYINNALSKEENPNSSTARFELNIKFSLFYFELFKRLINRHFNLNNRILSTLISYYNNNYVEKPDYESAIQLQVLDVKAMKSLNETVEEFYQTLTVILKYFCDKFTEIIGTNNVELMTVNQFAKLSAICQEVITYFECELKLPQSLNSWIISDKEGIKKPLFNLVSTLADKISIVPIKTLKMEYEKKFITFRYKNQHAELKQSLEQETWQPADIPYTYAVYFNLFFGIDSSKEILGDKRKGSEEILRPAQPQSEEVSANNTTTDAESVPVEEDRKAQENGKNGKAPEEFYSIKKNEVFINNMRFKTTSSFLLLLKIIYENYNIALRFKSVGSEAVSKIFEIIKFYNSYSIQLILGAGATTFGKIKKITAKILALSSVSLSLLLHLIDPLNARIIENIVNINQDWLQSEMSRVKNDLNHHINEITSKIRSILKAKLVEQCSELKRVSWANAQEKVNIPTKYSASILHNTRQMYKTIEDYLSKEHLIVIFNVVFGDIKDSFLPIFQNLNVESKLAAKRIKEELKYFSDDLYQIPIFQVPELRYADFEEKVFSLQEEKCNHLLEATSIN